MNIIKFSDYLLNEARVQKQQVIEDLLDIFNKKPLIKTNKKSDSTSSAMADERGMYSIAGLKNKLADKYTSTQVSNALQDIKTDKKMDLKTISVRHSLWKENIPYYYLSITKEEATALKEKYERQEKEANSKELSKKIARKPKPKEEDKVKPKVTRAKKPKSTKENNS